MLFSKVPYSLPIWASLFSQDNRPTNRIVLGSLPTPIHEWKPPGYEAYNCYVKRDDLSSFELSGNKVRKLEFLMAKAIDEGYDSIITIGGIQSNHARATACCARQLGLDPYLILRTPNPDDDPGYEGNLLLNRMVGAKIFTVSTGTYARFGSQGLLKQLEASLISEGKKPFLIPVGGSDDVGAWGYLNAIEEIIHQTKTLKINNFDHIIFACGSGGTANGIALGAKLSGMSSKIHAVCVCDTPGRILV